ncbi:MAG: FAD-binding protein [Gaiellaceae bacterium]
MLIAGAGMAGLVAAARARELGAKPVVLEKGSRPGGSMLLSSGVVWRYRSLDEFRAQCPGGDPRLQELVHGRLDDALAWLESLGAWVLTRETRNPLTAGSRFDPVDLTELLARAARDVHLDRPLPTEPEPPVVLATGGFAARFARKHGLLLRSNAWSEGDGMDFALVRGAALTDGMEEFFGRAMPLPPWWGEEDFVQLAQLYGRYALVYDEHGARIEPDPNDWSETRLVQEIARRGGSAWYLVDADALTKPTPYGTIGEVIERARRGGGRVWKRDGRLAVRVAAAVTHTIGGVRVDPQARVLDERGEPIEGLYAAGVDAGGIATGGYASGLAAALVLGLTAAENAAT